MTGLRMALAMFTIAPVQAGRVDRATAGRSLLWLPLIGVGLGGGAAVPLLARPWLPGPAGAALLAVAAVAVPAVLTRGLHLDGLADVADALGSNRSGGDADAIMKKSDIGPFGVVTLTLTLLAQAAATAACITAGRGWQALVLAGVVGRLAILQAATPRTPPLRPTGLGALVAGTVSTRSSTMWTAVVTLVCVGPALAGRYGQVLHLLAALILGGTAAALLRRHAVRRLGGVSGDVFGALSEVATTAVLVTMAVG